MVKLLSVFPDPDRKTAEEVKQRLDELHAGAEATRRSFTITEISLDQIPDGTPIFIFSDRPESILGHEKVKLITRR